MNAHTHPKSSLVVLSALLLLLAACESSATASTGVGGQKDAVSPPPTSVVVNKAEAAKPEKTCPVTLPTDSFTPPKPYTAEYPHEELVWYGTDGLWTALALDGRHGPRKGAFWSTAFPGGQKEQRPALEVTWTRLDGDEQRVIEAHDATNAYTVEEGWFMIGGIDPDEPGCWRVDASYKGATLSYVYEM